MAGQSRRKRRDRRMMQDNIVRHHVSQPFIRFALSALTWINRSVCGGQCGRREVRSIPRKRFEVCATSKMWSVLSLSCALIKNEASRNALTVGAVAGESIAMPSDFDHRKCPNCAGRTMHLTRVEPHSPDREDGYERHVYHCAECSNVSRFVFEVPSRQQAAAFG